MALSSLFCSGQRRLNRSESVFYPKCKIQFFKTLYGDHPHNVGKTGMGNDLHAMVLTLIMMNYLCWAIPLTHPTGKYEF